MSVVNNLPTYFGGQDTSDATATNLDILYDKTAYVNGEKITGAITARIAETFTPTQLDQVIPAGVYLAGDLTVLGDADLISKNIKSGVTIFNVSGDPKVIDTTLAEGEAAATSNYIAKGRVSWADGKKSTGNATVMKDKTFVVSTEDQTILGPTLIEKEKTILFKGEPNLIEENIKAGVQIGNVTGSYSGGDPFDFSGATIEQQYILDGYKGFDKNGDLIIGTIPTIDITSPIVPTQDAQQIGIGYLDKVVTVSGDANLVSANIKSGANIFGIPGKETVIDTEVSDPSKNTISSSNCLSGAVGFVNGQLVEGTCESIADMEIVPSKEDISLTGPKILQGNHTMTIKGDANLVEGNIRKGVVIFGVPGSYEGSGGGINEYVNFDTTEATSIQEVYSILHEGEYTFVSEDGTDYHKLPSFYTYNTICPDYEGDGANITGGISIKSGQDNAAIVFTLPIKIDSTRVLFYYSGVVSSWIQPSFNINLLPKEAVLIEDDSIVVDSEQKVFSESMSLSPVFNNQKIFKEITNAPIGEYYAQITIPQSTGGNVAILSSLGYIEL